MMEKLFDIVPASERSQVREVFHLLEAGNLDTAKKVSSESLRRPISKEAKAFLHYALGTAHLQAAPGTVEASRVAVSHFEQTLEVLSFADVHLMLGFALWAVIKERAASIATEDAVAVVETLRLIDRAVNNFRRAAELNLGFRKDAEEQTAKLKAFEEGLKRRWN